MILYADTSALVKRYIAEAEAEEVSLYLSNHRLIGTAAITYVEMAAALAKASRLGWVDEIAVSEAWKDFVSHWASYTRLPVTAGLIDRAAMLAWKHSLRAYDAVHLASALAWGEMASEAVTFGCFDKELLKAAQDERLIVWPQDPG